MALLDASMDLSAKSRRWTLESIGHLFVALIFLTSFYVKVEPAISDVMFFIAIICFYKNGLCLAPSLAPLFLCLLIYNLAGFVSYITIANDDFGSWQFILTSVYMSAAGFFFAGYIAVDPEQRFQHILKYYFIGATIAAMLGLLGYFHIASLQSQFTLYDRMVSGFKDPNVFATYLILPAVAMMQMLMLGKRKITVLNVASILIILMAIILAFSRGAWINFIFSSTLMIGFSFLCSVDQRQRAGIILKTMIIVGILAIVLAALLTMKETQFLFYDRLTLVKDYDAGEMGRFGNQRNAIPMLMTKPLGFGPLQFGVYFREAPHNTFLNAFASFGWLGGVTFFTMVVLNLFIGIRLAFTRSPFQASAIAVFSCMVAMTFQGVQIDTEHWRHFYWLIGLLWGFFAANEAHKLVGYTDYEILKGWRGDSTPTAVVD
jgi:O-Antigen ligase